MRDNRFYIYLHMNEDKTVAYIGKGSFDRCHSYSDRSKQWKKAFGKRPPIIEILAKDLTEEESLQKEKEYIEQYEARGVALLNKDSGGSGDSGVAHQKKTCKTIEELLSESKEEISQPEAN